MAAFIVCALAGEARADVVTLLNGERIDGMIVAVDDGSITVRWGAGRNTVTRRVRRAEVKDVTFTPPDAASIRTLARRADSQGDAVEAADLWRMVIALEPDDAADFISAARAFRAAGRHDEATAASRRAAILAPDDPRPLLEEGEAALASGHFKRAAERAVDYLKLGRGRPEEGYWLLGRAFERSNRPEDAADAYGRALEAMPSHAGAFERFVDIHLWKAAAIEAEKLARDFIQRAPDVRIGHLALARALYRQQRYGGAVDALKKASTLAGPGFDKVRVFLVIARARLEGRRPDVASADAAIAAELDPDIGRE